MMALVEYYKMEACTKFLFVIWMICWVISESHLFEWDFFIEVSDKFNFNHDSRGVHSTT